MSSSLLLKAFVYTIMGLAFLYIAVQSVTDTIWNPLTLIFAAVATLDFFVVFKLLGKYFRSKNNNV